jgi:hypothetical protein
LVESAALKAEKKQAASLPSFSGPILGLVVGSGLGLMAIAFYYSLPVHAGQLWVDGFHVHHLYIGGVIAVLSVPLWLRNHKTTAALLLGLGLVVVADGIRWALGWA